MSATPARSALRWLRTMTAPLGDPRLLPRAARGYARYIRDLRRYRRLPGAEPLRLADLHPALHDRTAASGIDPHYFFVNAWAMREVLKRRPASHVDVASQTAFASMLSAVLPVTYLDYRPLQVNLDGLTCRAGTLTALPYDDRSLESVSCLHVVEHVGLGRYGDPLDPMGTAKACRELSRVVAPGGGLLLALPVGRPRICFNAHRIIDPSAVLGLVDGLILKAFAGVDDGGRFHPSLRPEDLAGQAYACGMYVFHREAA